MQTEEHDVLYDMSRFNQSDVLICEKFLVVPNAVRTAGNQCVNAKTSKLYLKD